MMFCARSATFNNIKTYLPTMVRNEIAFYEGKVFESLEDFLNINEASLELRKNMLYEFFALVEDEDVENYVKLLREEYGTNEDITELINSIIKK
jgi:hypothetical protein